MIFILPRATVTVLALLGAGAALLAGGVRLAAHAGQAPSITAAQRAEQLVLTAAGAGIAAAGAWICLTTVVCLVDLVRRKGPNSRPGLLRPRVVQVVLVRACAPALGVAVLCAAGPVAADNGDLGRLRGLPLPERPTVTMPQERPDTSSGSTGRGTSPERPGPRGVGTDPTVHTVRPGDCLWSIAEGLLAARSQGRPASPAEAPAVSDVDRAWRHLYVANRSRVGPAPDLVQPGTRLVVPRPLRPTPPPSR